MCFVVFSNNCCLQHFSQQQRHNCACVSMSTDSCVSMSTDSCFNMSTDSCVSMSTDSCFNMSTDSCFNMSTDTCYSQSLIELGLSWQILEKHLYIYQIFWKLVLWGPSYCMRTDRQTDRRDETNSLLANASNNDNITRCWL